MCKPWSESSSLINSALPATLSTQRTSAKSSRRAAFRDARRRLRIRSAGAESWRLCSRASDLHRLHAAAAFDLKPQRETDRRFGAGQAAAPDGWDPSRRAAYIEIAGALEESWRIILIYRRHHNNMFPLFGQQQ